MLGALNFSFYVMFLCIISTLFKNKMWITPPNCQYILHTKDWFQQMLCGPLIHLANHYSHCQWLLYKKQKQKICSKTENFDSRNSSKYGQNSSKFFQFCRVNSRGSYLFSFLFLISMCMYLMAVPGTSVWQGSTSFLDLFSINGVSCFSLFSILFYPNQNF